MSEMTLIN